ncbi:ABC transporter ATP-binding protein [Fontibacillus sp. BL9]|uniref:ABC transporter ATP-binding protein n=1 Tax=Fontibacillus sp. BL9 TaxID=3389971 RepID=UPI003977F086
MSESSIFSSNRMKKIKIIGSYSKKVLGLLFSLAPGYLFLNILIKILQVLIPLYQVYLTTQLIDRIGLVFLGKIQWEHAFIIILIQTMLTYLDYFLTNINRLFLIIMSQRMSYYFDYNIIVKSSSVPFLLFEKEDYYKQKELTHGHSDRAIRFVNNLLDIIKNFMTILGYTGILISIHWTLVSGIIITVIPFLILNMRISKWKYELTYGQTNSVRRSSFLMSLLTDRNSAKEIRLYELFPFLSAKWSKLYWERARQLIQLNKKVTYATMGIDGFRTVLGFMVSGLLLWLGVIGKMTIGQYVALPQAILKTQSNIESIATKFSGIYEDAMYIKHYFEFLDLPEEKTEAQIQNFEVPLQQGILVKDLSFSYPGNPVALNAISFSIKPGETVAIVGENGSGKTTLIKCLLGLYNSYEGEIHYNGIELKQIRVSSLRRHVSAVFQDFVQYPLSVKENIALGDTDKINDNDLIMRAAEKSGADQFIRYLKNGYDTDLGPYFTGGQDISYGQWQKIAISRAFMRDAEVLILDEPTASLDPKAEEAIFERLMDISKGKTSIFISHRLGSCRKADRILVMQRGQLTESGSHEELMKLNGEYAQMFYKQAKWYGNEINYSSISI